MRLTCLFLAVSAAVPLTASAQVADTSHVDPRKTVFSVQPLFEGRSGPRLELERAVSRKVSLVLGSRLTMSQADFIDRFPSPAAFDLGVRYYGGRRTFTGPYAGVYAGYERTLRGPYQQTRSQLARSVLGGTVGYDLVFRHRLIIAPAVGAEYGRPDPSRVIRTWEVHPRLGVGFTFE